MAVLMSLAWSAVLSPQLLIYLVFLAGKRGILASRAFRILPQKHFWRVGYFRGLRGHGRLNRAFEAGVVPSLFRPIERDRLFKLIRVAESPVQRERRRFTRVPLRCGVSMESNGNQLEGATVDLSFDGMLVQSYLVFCHGTLVKVRLELQTGLPALQFEARVVRSEAVVLVLPGHAVFGT